MNIQKKAIKSIVDKAHELLIEKGICSRDGSGDPIIEGAISYLSLFADGQLVVNGTTSKKPRGDREYTIRERQFIVTDLVKLDDPTYISLGSGTYSEENLREWANDRWGTPKDATLNVIARDIKHGGWTLFEFIVPADADPKHTEKPELGTIVELGPGTPTPHPDRQEEENTGTIGAEATKYLTPMSNEEMISYLT